MPTATDILALSFNVDYWDYLGWKDTLASPDNTERQRDYAQARGDGQVYTPQIVVDGRTHVVGSNQSQVEAAIWRSIADGLPVPISLSSTGDAITVTTSGAADAEHAARHALAGDVRRAGHRADRPRREQRPHDHLHQRRAQAAPDRHVEGRGRCRSTCPRAR